MGADEPQLRYQAQCAGHEELRDITIETRAEVRMLSGQINQFMTAMARQEERIEVLEAERHQRIGAEKNATRTAAIVAGVISAGGVVVGLILTLWRGS